MEHANAVDLEKLTLLRSIISEILTGLSQDPEISLSHQLAILKARLEVLDAFTQQPRPQQFMANNVMPLLLFATFYSRYLVLATDCLEFCSNLPPYMIEEIVENVRPIMDHFQGLN